MLHRIAKHTRYQETIKKSKFIGICYPVSSDAAARAYIHKIEARYTKASHVCWAYRLRARDDARAYFSDAGEPANSAGPPIRTALESRALVNTLCLVVRYFGGIKLGIGGLIRAYRGVAGATLDRAGIETFENIFKVYLQVPHRSYADIMRLIESKQLSFTQKYQPHGARLTLEIPRPQRQSILEELKALPDVKIDTEPGQQRAL